MSFEINYLKDNGIIEVVFLVNFNWPLMEKAVPDIAGLIKEHDCHRILLDFRKIKIDLTTEEMYDTPAKLRDAFMKFGVELQKLKRAFLIISVDSDSYFFETVMRNQGQTFRIFLDRDLASEWLQQPWSKSG
jgi:hypothetical protein